MTPANDKIYYFKGTQYISFDAVTNTVDPHFPKEIADDFPGLISGSSIDAVGNFDKKGTLVFKGSQYMVYDFFKCEVIQSAQSIESLFVPGTDPNFFKDLDAVLVTPNPRLTTPEQPVFQAYFFKGPNFIHVDNTNYWSSLKTSSPQPISAGFTKLPSFITKVQAAMHDNRDGYAYLYNGTEYGYFHMETNTWSYVDSHAIESPQNGLNSKNGFNNNLDAAVYLSVQS